VTVLWSLDSQDSLYDDGENCTLLNSSTPGPCPTGPDIANQIIAGFGSGPGQGSNYGIILMHGYFSWTHDAIKILFDPSSGYMKQHGFRVGTVEDVICWKYGMHSWEIVNMLNPGAGRASN
jgi:hypothetical protein